MRVKTLWVMLGLFCSACAEQESASSPCDDETRSQPFEVGAEAVGEQERLVVDLVEVGASFLEVGSTNWVISISDTSSGEPISGCDVDVTLWMPDHGHGSGSPDLSEQTDGTYAIDDLFFSMGGYWTITTSITCAELTDIAVFGFCVES